MNSPISIYRIEACAELPREIARIVRDYYVPLKPNTVTKQLDRIIHHYNETETLLSGFGVPPNEFSIHTFIRSINEKELVNGGVKLSYKRGVKLSYIYHIGLQLQEIRQQKIRNIQYVMDQKLQAMNVTLEECIDTDNNILALINTQFNQFII